MRIRLTEKANMANGGYSWTKQGTPDIEEDVTGLEFDAFVVTIAGVSFTMIARDQLVNAGFTGFNADVEYVFKDEEYEVIEE